MNPQSPTALDRLTAAALIGRRILADLAHRPASSADAPRQARIDAALAWLCQAQDRGDDRGVSYGYTIKGGWQPSYIETTGYIISTFLRAAAVFDRPELQTRAIEAGRWLTQVQLSDGGFPNPGLDPATGVVFDTGQDLHGLVSLAETTADPAFLEASQRAASWLTAVADDSGQWTRNTFNAIPHVYNSRTAWALVRAGVLLDDPDAIKVAEANLDWACSQQRPTGWFDQCAFTDGAPPFTHTIAYAGRGLLEAGLILGNERYVDAARAVARAAAPLVRADGLLPSRIATDGQPADRASCLTGNAQFAIIWLQLAALDDDPLLRRIAERVIDGVAIHQPLSGPVQFRGAIKGSHPIWGRYAPLGHPNWATKFYLDALLLSQRCTGAGLQP